MALDGEYLDEDESSMEDHDHKKVIELFYGIILL